MSGYYPPGVTGNEPEIAGYPEGSEMVYCQSSYVPAIYLHGLEQATAEAQAQRQRGEKWGIVEEQIAGLTKAVDVLIAAIRDGEQVTVECDFGGEVDGYYVDDLFCWTCPTCGSEQEEYID